jgi:predicted ABC-type ATPase
MSKSVQKPKLIVIAGPNGSGKTTFTNQVLRHDWSEGCLFINPDEIAQNNFGDWNSHDAIIKAANRSKDLRETCLKERRSMLLETVFSAPDKLDFLRQAKEADFFIRFFFIGSDSPQINASRIARRVMAGGHTVPIEKIISRFAKSIANSAVAMTIADRAYAYDNSIDNRDPKKLFRTKSGIVFRIYPDLRLHEWGQLLLTTSEAGQ